MGARNRSQGWEYAKRSGHELEKSLARELVSDREQSTWLYSCCFGDLSTAVPHVHADGSKASPERCVLGGHTPAKADLYVTWTEQRRARISVKKSAEGQVWLVSLERFVLGFEAHYGVKVPAQVKEGLRLFIGPLEQSEMRGLLAGDDPEGPFSRKHGVHQELHQQRFVAKTLMRVAPDVWESTIAWLRMELPRITEMCFARGLCAEEKGRAEFVWYNVVDEESGRLSARRVIRIDELVRAIEALPMEKRASPGRKNGGSVITMPFGSLQMHSPNDDNQLQFRHRLLSVTALLPVR